MAIGLLCLVTLICAGQEPVAMSLCGMADVQEAALHDSLQGRWTSQIGRITVVMTFANSRVQIGGQELGSRLILDLCSDNLTPNT
jgi:hypothetical protein